MDPSQAPSPGGRLARRLFALFVLVALLPLAVSDWLSQTAVTQVAEGLHQQRQGQTTRQVSRQVYDRLLAARLLIGAWPAAADTATSPDTLPGVGSVFRRVMRADDGAHLAWTPQGEPMPLPASAPVTDRHPVNQALRLHVVRTANGPARVWLHRWDGPGQWFAEVDPGHLWEPVVQAGDDAAWQVHDVQGHTLFAVRGADYPAGASMPGASTADGTVLDTASRLFLDGGFRSDDWTFVQRAPRPVVQWQGRPLAAWLALVAVATLLTIAWQARRQIRRLLEPLERLTEGTAQLAAGHGSTRVAVQRDDEIGRLAGSFNHMAERIEAQFDALAGMTAIDRDILDGASLDRVVERVLHRLQADCPGAVARITWLDGPRQLRLAWLLQGAGEAQACHAEVGLDDAGLAQWRLLSEDACVPATDLGRAPWLPAPEAATATDLVCLFPLQLDGSPNAVLALRWPAAVPADLRQRASDLRDRLSVAMAARAREQELVHRAGHDSLTGLANRYGLHQRLGALLLQPQPVLAVLFVDLDHFKDVNDTRGHAAGDELLCQASARLQAVVPAGALVSRQGGDEFAIVLPGAAAEAAEACARAVVASLARAFTLQDTAPVLGASVGVSLCPTHGHDREELLRRADVALYAAKSAGRGCHVLFSPDLDQMASERMQLLAELRLAIERSEFVVHYQPRVLPADGSIRSAEALVRWQHPQRGLLMPGAFIGLAETSGLIDAIGSQVLEGTCRQLARWRRDGVQMERVSVNVSPQQLNSGRLPAQVRRLLDEHGLPGQMLELEVTESLLVGDSGAATAQLTQLRDWGVTVALDDFGTGYSSMATLRQLPIDVMKVDRSFVVDVCEDKCALAVASAIVALARAMSLHLVAEGVETEAQAQLLGRLGCDELQGFLYSRALPTADFERLPGLSRLPAPSAASSLPEPSKPLLIA